MVVEGSDDEASIGTFDSVLVAAGHRSYDLLSQALVQAGVSATVIGDVAHPGQILDATKDRYASLTQ